MPTEIDRQLEAHPPDIRALANQVRALVASIVPDAEENLNPWKVICYGFGPRMSEMFAVLLLSKGHVSLGLAHGSELPDPEGRLEGTGKKIRHVKIRTSAEVSDPAVSALLRAEIAHFREGRKKMVPAKEKAPAKKTVTAKKAVPAKTRSQSGTHSRGARGGPRGRGAATPSSKRKSTRKAKA